MNPLSNDFLNAAKGVCFICIGVFFIVATVNVTETAHMVQKEVPAIREDARTEIQVTRKELLGEVAAVRSDIQAIARLADGRLLSIQRGTIKEIQDTRKDAFQRVDAIHKDILPVRDGIVLLSTTYNALPAEIGARLDPFTDCKKNALCWQYQISDTMLASRTASRALAENTFLIANNVGVISTNIGIASNAFSKDMPVITSNIAGVASNINRITTPKWYDRLFSYAAQGSLMYFSLSSPSKVVSVGK